MVVADMPGYGFAYAHEKQREDWKGLVSLLFLQLPGGLWANSVALFGRSTIHRAPFYPYL